MDCNCLSFLELVCEIFLGDENCYFCFKFIFEENIIEI